VIPAIYGVIKGWSLPRAKPAFQSLQPVEDTQ
jgi:hypothetical protein